MLKRLVFLLISYLLMTGAACAAGVTISVAGQAKIGGPFVLLGDIAEINGNDGLRTAAFRALQLAASPPPGTSQVWTQSYLGTRLAATGADFSDVAWQVPEQFTVTSSAQTVRGTTLAQKALESLRNQVGQNSDEIEITLVGEVPDLVVPPGEIEIKVDFPAALKYSGVNAARATVWVNGQPTLRSYVKMEMRLYRNAVVANRVIMAGQTIKQDDLRLERTEVGALNRYYTDPLRLDGLAARRLINPGTLLTEKMFEKPLLIKRGSPVNLIAQIGEMKIATAGQAVQDGRVGQLIRVLNLSSNRLVSGTVIDADTVRVVTPGGTKTKEGESNE